MELCVNDKTTVDPTPIDIASAIDAAPHPEGWYLVLESDDALIDLAPLPDGTYEVSASDDGRELEGDKPFEAGAVKELLLKFLAGDAAWRSLGLSPVKPAAVPAARRAGKGPPPWALAIIVGTIAIVVIAFMVQAHRFFAIADPTWFYVGLIAAPMVVLFLVAVLAKMLEVRRAASWSTAVGRVVLSESQASRQRFADEATTATTGPLVEYEFSVGGRARRGNRVGIGEDSGGANTEATLRRYPVGAVVTVYYDPANPRDSVLERDLPKGVGKGLVFLLVFFAAITAGVYYLATNGSRLLSLLPDSVENKPFVIFAACFGLAVLLFFLAGYRMSRRAADWPMVRGTIVSSGSERVEGDGDSGSSRPTYTPAVEYRYCVNDVDYVSRQIKLGWTVSSGQGYAAKVAARYPAGSQVDVHYDPANPANAALENPSGLYWLLLVVALACFALAARAGGLI